MTLTVTAPDENPANLPEKDTLGLRSGQMYFLLRPRGPESPITTPVGALGRQGAVTTLEGLSIDFVREKRFTLLQVARNPGIPIFIAASLLMVGGLAITFYFPHRRVRGIIAPTPEGGGRAVLAPLARRDWSGQRAFERLVDGVEAHLGTSAVRLTRSRDADGPSDESLVSARGRLPHVQPTKPVGG